MLNKLFAQNRAWAAEKVDQDPQYFSRLAKQQAPDYLWIGCADSRVPANQIIDLPPGEVFVHRNIANVVAPNDLNCLAVIEYSLNVLKIEHIIVCGHYGCGGVKATLDKALNNPLPTNITLVQHWLSPIDDLYRSHQEQFQHCPTYEARLDLLCELNVIEQTRTLSNLPTVQQLWQQGRSIAIHGLIYDVSNGILKKLVTRTAPALDHSA